MKLGFHCFLRTAKEVPNHPDHGWILQVTGTPSILIRAGAAVNRCKNRSYHGDLAMFQLQEHLR